MSVKQHTNFKSTNNPRLKSKYPFNGISLSVILGCILICFSSCAPALYSPVLLGSDISYQPKPMTIDSVKSNMYFSAIVNLGSADNFEDEQYYTELNFSRAHAFQKFNLSYGAYGFWGTYNNGYLESQDAHYFETKSFGGYGLRLSANHVMPFGRSEFRFPGIELSYSNEMGEFAHFRKEVSNQPGFLVNSNTQIFSIGGSAEIIWHQRKYQYNRYSIRLMYGKTLGNDEYQASNNDPYINKGLSRQLSLGFIFQHKQFSFIYETGRVLKLGLIYSLK